MSVPAPRRRRSGAAAPDRRAAIVEAARRLFGKRRFHEITLDEVARVAQVGKGTIYLYFHDKDDLFFEAAASGFDDLCRSIRSNVAEDAPFDLRLRKTCVEIGRFFEQRRDVFRLMQLEEARMPGTKGKRREQWLAQRGKLVDTVSAVLRQGIEGGSLRHDIEPKVLAELLLGMLRARNRNLSDLPDEQRTHEVLVRLFLDGAAAR